MLVKDLIFKPSELNNSDNYLEYCYLNDFERITVLDRLTGYSGGIRDIETGYKDKDGKFWLASGGFDIRDYPELTIRGAINKIKINSNTCKGE